MVLRFSNTIQCDIELAFTGFSNKEVDEPYEMLLLSNADFWRNEIMIWIECLRKDSALNFPKALRQNNSLSIGLEFTDDASITQLNKQWRHKLCSTDVLSFPVFDERMVLPGNHAVELGDIVVSVPTAQNQADQQNHRLGIELRWLVSHGLLHLLGWDHPDENKLNEMLILQERLLMISGNLQTGGI